MIVKKFFRYNRSGYTRFTPPFVVVIKVVHRCEATRRDKADRDNTKRSVFTIVLHTHIVYGCMHEGTPSLDRPECSRARYWPDNYIHGFISAYYQPRLSDLELQSCLESGDLIRAIQTELNRCIIWVNRFFVAKMSQWTKFTARFVLKYEWFSGVYIPCYNLALDVHKPLSTNLV